MLISIQDLRSIQERCEIGELVQRLDVSIDRLTVIWDTDTGPLRRIFKNLKQEHAQKSDDDQRAVQIHGITDDSREADQQEGVDQNREGTAEEAQFLYDNRKNEVRLLHRDEVQTLLRSLKEPFSEETTGAHGNLGLPDLVVAGKT